MWRVIAHPMPASPRVSTAPFAFPQVRPGHGVRLAAVSDVAGTSAGLPSTHAGRLRRSILMLEGEIEGATSAPLD
jgi:hypothetical protein